MFSDSSSVHHQEFFTVHTTMVYVIQVCWQLDSEKDQDGTPSWHIPLLCVQWKTPDDGQRNCPKHVEFFSKNKFEKLVHLVGFIIGTEYTVKYICVKPIYSTHTFFSPAGPSSRKTINVGENYWSTEEWHCQVRLPVLYYVEVPLFSSHPLTRSPCANDIDIHTYNK